MKNFQQNLLISLALGLCTLCVWQWYGQTLQRTQLEQLTRLLNERNAALQSHTNSIKTMDQRIAQMDMRITELKGLTKTNEETIAAQRQEMNRLQTSNRALGKQVEEYKSAVSTLNEKLKEAYAGVERQNDSIKQLVLQRDDFVKRLNKSIRERNEVVDKYNALVEQVKKAQDGTAQKQ